MKDNVGRIYDGCTKDSLEKWQSENKNITIEAQGLVKIGFDYEENSKEYMEFMWVLVDQVREDTIFGRLWNDPIKATYVKFKSAVVCKRSQVTGYLAPKKPDFKLKRK